ncbi:hypothetical protein BH23GEM9_BH23GEM9_08800 [soil metagenome]
MSRVLHRPVYTLRIELVHIEPVIWRHFDVPAGYTLAEVHDVIQRVMGWHDSHLHAFEIGTEGYGPGINEYDEDEQDEAVVQMGDVGLQVGDRFTYIYDFGDDWAHTLTVESIRRDVAADDVPRVVAGDRACPPDDCGGVSGYYDLLEALADPQHEDHDSAKEWLGRPWDPGVYDVARHQRELSKWMRRRSAPRAGTAARTAPRSARRQSPRDMTPPHMARANEVLALMDPLRDAVPWLPDSVVGLAAELVLHYCLDFPDEFLAVRKPELWLAATVHAAFRLHPGEVRRHALTLQDLADICGVSVASISKRSRQLREGVRVEWRKA